MQPSPIASGVNSSSTGNHQATQITDTSQAESAAKINTQSSIPKTDTTKVSLDNHQKMLSTPASTNMASIALPKGLPESLEMWLKQTHDEILAKLLEEFPNQDIVNRQLVAANPTIQALLINQADALFTHQDFSSALKGQFIMSRVKSQPRGSHGERPSETNAGLEMAAFHTAAGLGEIVCKAGEEWPKALNEHFNRVGVVNSSV